MIDLADWFELPRNLLVGALRLMWWLAWDLLVETIGWTIGWFFWRMVSVGRFPCEGLGQQEEAPWTTHWLLQATGLGLLALAIWALTGAWP